MKIVRTFAFRSSGVAVWIAEREDAKVALTLDYAHRLVVGIQRFMGISSPFFLWFGKRYIQDSVFVKRLQKTRHSETHE
jgi:hypothetical protein